MALTLEKYISVKQVLEKWNDASYEEDITLPFDWKSKAIKHLREGDPIAMRNDALPSLQYKLLSLAHEGRSEQIQLQAASTVMAQAGHGPVQRVEATVNIQQIPTDQLQSMLASKLQHLAELSGLDAHSLLNELSARLPAPPIDAEFTAVQSEPETAS